MANEEINECLTQLIADGLTFGACVRVFAAQQTEDCKDYVDRARDAYHSEGEIEVDENAIVSEADDGAYVMAWVWVGDGEAADDGPADDSITVSVKGA